MFVYMMIPESLDVLALYQEFSNGESVLSNHRSLKCETEASCQRIPHLARTRLTNGKACDLVLKRRRMT